MVSISVGSALDFNFIDLTADFDQRPSARAMRFLWTLMR